MRGLTNALVALQVFQALELLVTKLAWCYLDAGTAPCHWHMSWFNNIKVRDCGRCRQSSVFSQDDGSFADGDER